MPNISADDLKKVADAAKAQWHTYYALLLAEILSGL
jgi:hypothetical protein